MQYYISGKQVSADTAYAYLSHQAVQRGYWWGTATDLWMHRHDEAARDEIMECTGGTLEVIA
jgi:hypothetical protein